MRGDNLPPSTALLLVAVMPSPRDLEIAPRAWLVSHPIPVLPPKIVQVDYLAFYQPASFGKRTLTALNISARCGEWNWPMRKEIIRDEPDHPRADEEYYKMQLGKLERLQTPIPADKWKRITFLYTTGELFARARIINDLVVKSEERKI